MLNSKWMQRLNWLCLGAIVLYTLWYTTSFQIRHRSLERQFLLDYGDNYERSQRIIEDLTYPPWSRGFFYPPPNVVLRLELGRLGLRASAAVWMAMMVAATLLSICLSLYLMGLSKHPWRYIIALIALSAAEYFFEWDLKYLNGNVLYLASLLVALVLHEKGKPVHAGFWLAFSMVLKVYSAVFLPYYLLRGQYRLCMMTIFWTAVFFIGLPIVYLGADRTILITESWIRTVLESGSSETLPFELAAYLLSLHKTLLILLTDAAGKGVVNVMNLGLEEVRQITHAVQASWLVLVALYFVPSIKGTEDVNPKQVPFLDAGALTLLVLPLSPALQPHHGVVMLIPAMALVGFAMDAGRPRQVRWTAGLIILACYVELEFGPALILRGIGMMSTMALFMSGLILVRIALRRPAVFHNEPGTQVKAMLDVEHP